MVMNNYRRYLGKLFALSILGFSFSSAVFASDLICTQEIRMCKDGKPALRAVDSCAQICPEDNSNAVVNPSCPKRPLPVCKDGELITVKGQNGCPVKMCRPFKPVCKRPSCPLPKLGLKCSYNSKEAPVDANGCATGCGPLVCEKPVACREFSCVATRAGCSYNKREAPKDANGCATGCGPLVCDGNSSGAGAPRTRSGSAQ